MNWRLKKVEQALLLSRWLGTVDGPIIVGADMNTPDIDHPDRESVRTHWHTGMRKLKGEPGDDLMFGGSPSHALDDAFRLWLDEHPDDLARIREERPDGPLAISHRTGRTGTSPGVPRRYDTIWISKHLRVAAMSYDYDSAVPSCSDHALVHAELKLPWNSQAMRITNLVYQRVLVRSTALAVGQVPGHSGFHQLAI